ncbi:hypothetical protein HHK36_019410 [Tetracentron sinense]|uniref:Uncharacterized protein n=1 Tax=Tetracentron sinense TaxID=13715 RepID=A0A835DCR1_TETSI|nr:hypothetical protein HHK36_019410 [Tetracentron sinense]
MAEFSPDLDDGELWLPSDIFPDEVTAKLSPNLPSDPTYMEDLSAYALVNPNRNATKPPPSLAPNSEFRPTSRYSLVDSPRTGYGFGVDGVHPGVRRSLNGNGNGGFGPVYQYHPMKPAHTQVEGFVETRSRVLQRQQNQVGNGMGGFVRESGGTGVFLPRVATTTYDRKKQSGKNRLESQQRQLSTKQVAVGMQERFQSPTDMGLPQDWIY